MTEKLLTGTLSLNTNKQMFKLTIRMHFDQFIAVQRENFKKILDYFRSINCTNISIHGCNCCKTGIEVSECVHLACMAVKTEHTVDGHNHILQQGISDVYASQVRGLTQSKTCQIYAFVHRNLFACTENYIKFFL